MASIPKGTRDFLPKETLRRNYIFDTIKDVFKLFGYSPIETPAMENLSTLLGKYGDEGDKLLFKILNSGDYLDKLPEEVYKAKELNSFTSNISEKGLRYDLTVPFARFVVQHKNDIIFPFKRYQMQPVWRADRPQKGRYREFYQCDADVIGSDSLLNEVELISLMDEVFNRLSINTVIKLNNRKILAGIAEIMESADYLVDITVAIDKLEKVGYKAVELELLEKGIDKTKIDILKPILELSGSFEQKKNILTNTLNKSTIGIEGLQELDKVFSLISQLDIKQQVELDLSLARGLNYYTGAIIEVKAKDVEIGSICGGGRYDNLTGIFGLKGVSGVGISFGADRIYDVLTNLDLFPDTMQETKVLFVNMGEEVYCLEAMHKLRKEGISCEIYPELAKMKKQLEYADKRGINYVAIAGENEKIKGIFSLKDMKKQIQEELSIEAVIIKLKNN